MYVYPYLSMERTPPPPRPPPPPPAPHIDKGHIDERHIVVVVVFFYL